LEFIPVNQPLLDGNEKKYLQECIDTGWISSEGPFVKKFEDKFSKRIGRKFGVAVCNGSAALEAAVIAAGIKEGDEVIMPSFTIISCASAVVRAGGIPVLVDCEGDTFNIDAEKIKEKITKKTKAIMVVHIYGLPSDMDKITLIAMENNLKIIEDAAEVIGQTYNGKPCGSFGEISTFSFYPNKHITTGEGGMIVTDDEGIAERCRSLRNLCFGTKKRSMHNEMGFNFRMTNLQAAVGLAQLERLDEFICRKRHIGKLYNDLLQSVSGIDLPVEEKKFAKNIYWVFGIVINDSKKHSADFIIKKLAENKIGTRPFFYPMHLQPVFKNMNLFADESYPVSERIAEQGFYIPSGLGLKDEQIEYTSEVLKKIFKN